jgi:hypothetical protein
MLRSLISMGIVLGAGVAMLDGTHAADTSGRFLVLPLVRGVNTETYDLGCRAQKLDRSIMRPAHKHDEDLRARILRRSFQLGRVDAAQMAPARRAHVVQSNGVGASG